MQLRNEVYNHIKEVCDDMPDELANITADLATHAFLETRETILRIAKTAPQPSLVALAAVQLIKIWAENEIEEMKSRTTR